MRSSDAFPLVAATALGLVLAGCGTERDPSGTASDDATPAETWTVHRGWCDDLDLTSALALDGTTVGRVTSSYAEGEATCSASVTTDDPLLAATVRVLATVVDAEDGAAAWDTATGADLLGRWDQLGVDGTSTDPAPADWGDQQYAAGAVGVRPATTEDELVGVSTAQADAVADDNLVLSVGVEARTAVEPGAEDTTADALTADTERWATAALDRVETLRP